MNNNNNNDDNKITNHDEIMISNNRKLLLKIIYKNLDSDSCSDQYDDSNMVPTNMWETLTAC